MSDLQIKGYEKFGNPFYMAAVTAVVAFCFMAFGKIIGFDGFTTNSNAGQFPWMCASALLLIYMIFSSMFSLISDDFFAYYRKAFLAFIGLMGINSGLAYLFSGFIWISEMQVYKTIFFIFIFAYLVLYVMTMFIKKIINMAQREDEAFNRRNSRNN